MFIAHFAGGYLGAKAARIKPFSTALIATLAGSILPDIDLFLFYFRDGRAFHHHEYLTHRPILWLVLLLIGYLLLRFSSQSGFASVLCGLGFGGVIHMVLDSVAGSIAWGWPFSNWSAPLVVVQATHDHWVKSFLAHWTFKIELVLLIGAIVLALRSNKPNSRFERKRKTDDRTR